MNGITYTQEFLLAVAFHFERENGANLSAIELNQINQELSADTDLNDLKSSIAEAIQSGKLQEPILGTAIWALGKSFDSSLKSLYIEQLAKALQIGAGQILFQSMIALDNLDEPVSQNRTTRSVSDEALNLNDAHTYLANLSK